MIVWIYMCIYIHSLDLAVFQVDYISYVYFLDLVSNT